MIQWSGVNIRGTSFVGRFVLVSRPSARASGSVEGRGDRCIMLVGR